MSVTYDNLNGSSQGDSDALVKWFVRKPDGSVYGPETAAVLLEWAAECRIVSGNEVSKDKKHWIAAEDLPHLQMNWIAESPDGRRYGPFNILATRELFEHEVLTEDAVLKDLKTGATSTVAEQLKSHPGRRQDVLFEEPAEQETTKTTSAKRGRPRRKETGEGTVSTAETEALRQQIAELAAQRKALEKKVRQQQKLLKQQEDALDADRRDHAGEQEKLRKEIEQLREATGTAAGGVSGAAVEQVQEEVRSLTDELSKARETATQLQGVIEAKEQERRTLEDAADKREQELLAQVESLQADAAGLRLQLEEHVASAAGQAQATGRLAELEERRAAEDSRLSDALARAKQAETAQSNAESRHRTEKADLENRFSRTRRQLGSVEMALRQSRHRVSILSVMAATLLVLLFVLMLLYVRSKNDLQSSRASVARLEDGGGKTADGEEEAAGTPGGGLETGTGERRPGPTSGTSEVRPAGVGYPRIRVPGISTTFSGKSCVMVFDKPVFSSLTTISPEANRLLGQVSGQMRDYMPKFRLTVRGHTDNTPLRSSQLYADNEALGLARAKAVTDVLQKRNRLPADRLRATSAGDRDPPFPNDTPENRRKNRTVVLILERE